MGGRYFSQVVFPCLERQQPISRQNKYIRTCCVSFVNFHVSRSEIYPIFWRFLLFSPSINLAEISSNNFSCLFRVCLFVCFAIRVFVCVLEFSYIFLFIVLDHSVQLDFPKKGFPSDIFFNMSIIRGFR